MVSKFSKNGHPALSASCVFASPEPSQKAPAPGGKFARRGRRPCYPPPPSATVRFPATDASFVPRREPRAEWGCERREDTREGCRGG